MILGRYLQRNIYFGTLLALLVLVSLNLFFVLVREAEDIGQGGYGFMQAIEYLVLLVPARIVEFLPLAVLLGCILSLGAMAGNSEIIAMQASGVSLSRLLTSVIMAGIGLALISFLLSEWVVPDSSTNARAVKSLAKQGSTALRSREGLWIKDGDKVIRIAQLLPNGFARDVQIYQLDTAGKLVATMYARYAEPMAKGWALKSVEVLYLDPLKARSETVDRLYYEGDVSHELLQVLMIKPSRMSRGDLYAYLEFLDENRLEAQAERLIFWQKIFAPLTIIIMCLLAFPFILGEQRQSSTGYRLMIGILLGLSFAAVDRLLTQLGVHFDFNPVLVAFSPSLLFFGIAVYLLRKRTSHRVGFGASFGIGKS